VLVLCAGVAVLAAATVAQLRLGGVERVRALEEAQARGPIVQPTIEVSYVLLPLDRFEAMAASSGGNVAADALKGQVVSTVVDQGLRAAVDAMVPDLSRLWHRTVDTSGEPFPETHLAQLFLQRAKMETTIEVGGLAVRGITGDFPMRMRLAADKATLRGFVELVDAQEALSPEVADFGKVSADADFIASLERTTVEWETESPDVEHFVPLFLFRYYSLEATPGNAALLNREEYARRWSVVTGVLLSPRALVLRPRSGQDITADITRALNEPMIVERSGR
jgi:hypothetical protein